MAEVRVIGLDIAKSVFQVHGVDAAGATVLRKRLTRSRLLPFFEKLPPCLVGIEACATSHFWARELMKLGHEVKLMPAQYVKPYVRRQKNDMADAEAIAEAVTRPSMRFVAPKSPAQQSAMMLHKVRLMLWSGDRQKAAVRKRTPTRAESIAAFGLGGFLLWMAEDGR
jgi:transposase